MTFKSFIIHFSGKLWESWHRSPFIFFGSCWQAFFSEMQTDDLHPSYTDMSDIVAWQNGSDDEIWYIYSTSFFISQALVYRKYVHVVNSVWSIDVKKPWIFLDRLPNFVVIVTCKSHLVCICEIIPELESLTQSMTLLPGGVSVSVTSTMQSLDQCYQLYFLLSSYYLWCLKYAYIHPDCQDFSKYWAFMFPTMWLF